MRGRRLRTNEVIRSMVRETVIHKEELIYPLFVVEGEGIKEEIPSMPDNYRFSIDKLMEEIKEIYELGIKGVLIFGIPDHKDELGTSAYCEGNIVAKAISEIKKYYPDMYVVADVCLCEYTNHGHCGFIENGYVNNDKTLPLLAKAAVSYAEAGADMIAPSDMMDGRISYIRKALDDAGFVNTVLMSYSAKYCSAFYGPFRDAADSAPKFGDRKTYQMDPANGREALKEILADIDEGADIIMVKPALPYLDVIKTARENVNVPVCAYNVSGEYSMIKAADKMGWLDGKKAAMESLVSIKRAGADIIITYFAKEFAKGELY
ncbi:delta-aminolevulinic acid dehydratase [Tyzzerella sp. An114]|uniref:porphobilinogen synthase n=1 Tax=Tyzzerella sp. An114 TaxID=1965545 RepID=UPI000B448005|nr:porphobilinogen synthase [Tyzzerella sp. An114]OUQ57141.1 delta-aminolevulinic acid dehydratase [Tyzzerella sp. An114]